MKNLYTFFITITIIISFGSSLFAKEQPLYLRTYAALLERYVEPGNKDSIKTNLVNYKAWAKDLDHLKAMGNLQRAKLDTLTGNDKKAFWINAYNILTIDLIIKNNEEESIKNLGSIFNSPWKSHEWEINGNEYTLDEIEHEILRPMWDPRIHMAINCASLSCPDLADTPYLATKLDEQLDLQTKIFLENSTKGVDLTSDKSIKISKLFKWFAEDFDGEKGVISFINAYRSLPIAFAPTIEYFDYSWRLNNKN